MSAISTHLKEFSEALRSQAFKYQVDLSGETIERLSDYYQLLNGWNDRLHLVAPCTPREFATRHVLESLMLLAHLPRATNVADIGSGAGLPIIPCLIARADIKATLIESSKKKAVFLREAVNRSGLSSSATVIGERFEDVSAPEADFVTCRALDRFEAKLPGLLKWSPPGSTLLFFGGERLRDQMIRSALSFKESRLPDSQRRFLFVIQGNQAL